MSILRNIHYHANNLFGTKTKRKIIVFESDDWGSIRMSGKKAFKNLMNAGVLVDKSYYNLYDGLESNADLEGIFDVFSKFRDKTGRHPVVTGANIVANPDFIKIKDHDFSQYFFETFTETYRRYGVKHNMVENLYAEGIEKRLFVPAFHGREHLNVLRWIKALQSGHKIVHKGFENEVTGMPCDLDLQAAFAVDDPGDIIYHQEIIKEGLEIFHSTFGFRTPFFIAPNGPFNASSYTFLKELGFYYLNSRKKMVLPDTTGKFVTDYRYTGMRNKFGQYYIIRNAFFEPSSNLTFDHVGECLKQIETSFFWQNPVIISSHRVNYIGWLHPGNRDRGLALLNELLNKIFKRWPDVEFFSTIELGDFFKAKKG